MEQFAEFFNENLALFVALFIILFFLLRTWAPSSVTALRPAEAIRLANSKDAVYLDVRTDDEFSQGHILDAYHIPLGLLSGRIGEIEDLKSKPIIIYCRTGNRSSQAGSLLKKLGFSDLYHINGGISAWQHSNLPVTKTETKQVQNKKSKKTKKTKSSDDKKIAPANDDVEEVNDNSVVMYVTQRCPFCLQAKKLLSNKGVEFTEIDIDEQPEKRTEMETRSGRDSVPQIFIAEQHVGGCDDLHRLDRQGELDSILGLHNDNNLVSKPSANGVSLV